LTQDALPETMHRVLDGALLFGQRGLEAGEADSRESHVLLQDQHDGSFVQVFGAPAGMPCSNLVRRRSSTSHGWARLVKRSMGGGHRAASSSVPAEISTTSGFSAILPSTCEPQFGQKARDTALPAL